MCGARPDRAETLAKELVTEGATVLVSAGLAGGLDPKLRPGDVVWSSAVPPDYAARAGLAVGVVLGRDAPALSIEEKAALFQQTRASVIDMESHRVARVAAHANVPFVAVRSVVDAADKAVPEPIMTAVSEDGRPRLLAIVVAISRQPQLAPPVLHLATCSSRALAALERNVAHLPQCRVIPAEASGLAAASGNT